MLSAEANDLCEADKKKTITPGHILRAMEKLGLERTLLCACVVCARLAGVCSRLPVWEKSQCWGGERLEHRADGCALVMARCAALRFGGPELVRRSSCRVPKGCTG